MGVKVMKEEGQDIKVGLVVFRGADSAAVSFSFQSLQASVGFYIKLELPQTQPIGDEFRREV